MRTLHGFFESQPAGFEPVKGKQFTFQTKPAGVWDGTIHCPPQHQPEVSFASR
jgi:hypothetical protein